MLDLGFEPHIRAICSHVSAEAAQGLSLVTHVKSSIFQDLSFSLNLFMLLLHVPARALTYPTHTHTHPHTLNTHRCVRTDRQ
jgi:hypothetical protein